MPNGGWEGQEGSPKTWTPLQDHAAVPRTLRGATNGASGGDSPMSGPSRSAGGAAVAPSAEMVDQFGARQVVFKSARLMCARARGESGGITPCATTTGRGE